MQLAASASARLHADSDHAGTAAGKVDLVTGAQKLHRELERERERERERESACAHMRASEGGRGGGPSDVHKLPHAETDKECEKLIFSRLKQAFPTHAFIGEEESSAQGFTPDLTQALTWMVDPVDGASCAGAVQHASGAPARSWLVEVIAPVAVQAPPISCTASPLCV